MKKIKLLNSLFVAPLLISPITMLATSCNKNNDKLVNSLYESTISEFIDFVKHPHPSLALDEIRTYLTNKISSMGYLPMRDNYGNIWFDIPASTGYEEKPKIILQGHMDMVVAGLDAEQAKIQGISVSKKTIDGREVLQSTGKATGQGTATSLGADDGIGVAIIIALAMNNSFNHGPIRAIFTADEEKGLRGAAAISSAALDTDFLLNLDGEGAANKEYIIENGCGGLSNYILTNEYDKEDVPTETGWKKYSLKVEGFEGKLYNDEADIIYDNNGPKTRGNANRYVFEVLYELIKDGSIDVRLSSFSNKPLSDGNQYAAGSLPKDATICFATNANEAKINDAINTVHTKFSTNYKGDDYSKVTKTLVEDTSSSIYMSKNDSSGLIKYWGNDFAFGVDGWCGSTQEEKKIKNYPLLNLNCGLLKLSVDSNKIKFYANPCGMIGQVDQQQKITNYYEVISKQDIPTIKVEKVKNYTPWDIGNQTKMVDLLVEGFKSYNINPVTERTRAGLEPAWFIKRRSTMQQACIGPRIDNIHTVDETLYLDTVPNIIKAVLYVINNIDKLKA